MNAIDNQVGIFFEEYRKANNLPNTEYVSSKLILLYLAEKELQRKFERIYDVLIEFGKANWDDKDSFIYNHIHSQTEEWRFQGALGFGGKYRSKTNAVDCYFEDMNDERKELIELINSELAKLNSEFNILV